MYKFCEQRGLREVWGYMWGAWYCPAKYKLWARASQPNFVGRWRTTMSVENFWRSLKHGTLHHLLHPRLDQLIYLIATEVLPSFEAKMQIFDPNYRPGRAKVLTPFQRQFKKGWKTLASRTLGSREYQTDISRWTCTCGQQKYNALLLCKHLVQSVHPPDPAFFREVIRRRVIPFYRHPLLKPKNGSTIDPGHPTEDGSISDGDAVTPTSTSIPTGDGSRSPGSSTRGVKRKRATVPSHDNSPAKDGMDGSGGIDDPLIIPSSPVSQEFIKKRITELQNGINILQGQLATPVHSKIWLKSMKARNIGQDVAHMVNDVRHFTQTGTTRPTTWGKAGNKASIRYTQNTMGYHTK
ncbi:hypothetical protein DFH07DRAFT_742802 [Mycena maculata]|uniref:SWIM-type domain-containing protein n=1 Tax=Mycena maculata TaxID=230809 RepID=A0AAD7NE39_9AGAR|nr:hypothetical protein DFH07DRAFT_742802 [Mycena maculata]